MKRKIFTLILAGLLTMSCVGCSSQNGATKSNTAASSGTGTHESNTESKDNTSGELPNLAVRFGQNGSAFALKLYNNDTAVEIAKYVGEADWNLPIYHFDDFDNYKVMQYYDIPSKYKITSAPETVTSEKAGEVYYSSPNRIILFYQDAQVKGDFTKVVQLESTNGLEEAVEKNPVLEGWGNKIVSISPAK